MPSLPQTAAKQLDPPPAPTPARPTYENLGEAVQECRAREMWEGATQAVMGEGGRQASLMLVGEQPGDREDVEGHPFVGPAGRVLDQGLERAGIARDEVYITNAVKHFGYKLRGKRRTHQEPDRRPAERVSVTTHPSAIVRAENKDREEAMTQFVDDLEQVAQWLTAR